MTELLKEACEKVAAKNEDSILEGPNVLGLQDFDSSKIVIRVLAKTVNGKQGDIERQIQIAIKRDMAIQPTINLEN